MMTATAHHWLPAAPFRSHVRALIDSSGLPWRAIALEARVPPGVVRTLLLGRDGRHHSKIPRLVAQNLQQRGDLGRGGGRRGGGGRGGRHGRDLGEGRPGEQRGEQEQQEREAGHGARVSRPRVAGSRRVDAPGVAAQHGPT